MPNRVPWTERRFSFDYPVDIYPELLERVRGTPARVEELVAGAAPDILTRRDGESWSIQEIIGHLADVDEGLFSDRLEQFLAGESALKAADLSNPRTRAADHNARSIIEVLSRLRAVRGDMVQRCEALSPEDFARTAHHPRLNQPTRLVDMLLFAAEHDDYHLARMRELRRRLTA